MRGVYQSRVGHPRGDCYRAAIATAFGVGLDDVPDIHCETDEWAPLGEPQPAATIREWRRISEAWRRWFATMNLFSVRHTGCPPKPCQLSIGTINSRSGPWRHAVVCLGKDVVWDPNPAGLSYGAPVIEWEWWVVADPRKPVLPPTATAPSQWMRRYMKRLAQRQKVAA